MDGEGYRHVVVEPHFDDAALSCGGPLLALAARGGPAPLAVGNHVDHQIALAASQGLGPRLLYEDFPYSARPALLGDRLHAVGPRPGPAFDVAGYVEAKIAAIGCYRSQIPTLFGDVENM